MKMTKNKKIKIYNELVNKYYKDLFRYAYKLTNSEAIAEDVLQETLIRAWNSLESLNEIDKAKSWMMTTLKIENLRRVTKEKVNITDNYDNFDYLISDDDDIERNIDKEIIYANIKDLKECYSQPLALQVVYGYSVEEIAKKLDLNENTVSTRLFRGKSLLEKKLNQTIKNVSKVTIND